MNLNKLLWKDITRRPYRSLTIALCFAFISGSMLSSVFLMQGTESSIQAGMDRLGADLMVVPYRFQAQSEASILTGQPSSFRFSTQVYDQIVSVNGVTRACPQIYIATLSNQACCSEPVQLIGFNQSLDFTVQPWLISQLGRSLAQDEILVGGLIVGDIGSQLMFYGHNFTIAGRLDRTGMGMDCSIFIRDVDAYVMAEESPEKAVEPVDLPQGMISAVLVKVSPEANKNLVATEIRASIPQTSILTSGSLMSTVTSQVSEATRPLLLSTALVALASIPLIATITVMAVNERRGEIGVLRTVGATKRQVFMIIILNAVLVAAIGSMAGSAVATVLLYSFQSAITAQLSIPFLWPSLTAGLLWTVTICGAAVCVGAISAVYPAWKASKIDPYSAMRGSEN
jgi:putative ABC transport system permease protein